MVSQTITMKVMLDAGIHFGHLTKFRHPKMSKYIFGINNKINIINLEKTFFLFAEAMKFIDVIATKGGQILFVGTKKPARKIIEEYAKKCDMPYVNHRWLGGMLTNYKTIKQSIRRLNELDKIKNDGTLEKLTKKEGLNIVKERNKLSNSLGGIKDMGGLPDALFIVDVGHEKTAVSEANRLKIPIVGVVDTNNDPGKIDYIIPGNDDAIRSIKLYAENVSDIIIKSKEKRKELVDSKYNEEFIEIDSMEEKKSS